MRRNTAIVVCLTCLTVSAALAADPDARKLPGFVDGSAFADLATEDSSLVEVNLGKSLLRALARSGDEGNTHTEENSIFRQLDSIQAYIVELEKDPARTARAEKMVKDIETRLLGAGWESLARVREKDERVVVLVRNNDETIDGLTVLVFDRGESEVVFVNIAGKIDLAKLGEVSAKLDIPGLDAVGGDKKAAPGSGSKPDSGAKPKSGTRPPVESRGDADGSSEDDAAAVEELL